MLKKLYSALHVLWVIECWIKKNLKKAHFFPKWEEMLYVLGKTVIKMYKNYSPVSRDINSLPQARHTNKKTHVRMWGTILFSWKLFPNEDCTTLTQRKSNLAVRLARLWESWHQSDVTYSWNVTAAPNYWLSLSNKSHPPDDGKQNI